MTLRVPDAPPSLTVRVAGAAIPLASLGSPQAFDPGEVEVVAEAPGFQTFRQRLRLAPGGMASVDVALQRLAPLVELPELPPDYHAVAYGALTALGEDASELVGLAQRAEAQRWLEPRRRAACGAAPAAVR